MNYDFLMQAIKILHTEIEDKSDLYFIYDYVTQTSDETIIQYKKNITIISYNNDVELFIEIINELIKLFENDEDFERCAILLKKKKRVIELTNFG